MNNTSLIIIFSSLLISFVGCHSQRSVNKLNDDIDITQRKCLENPYFGDKNLGLVSLLDVQKKNRKQYINKIDSILVNTTDTIILREDFIFACIGCYAYKVDVFAGNELISYEMVPYKKNYNRSESVIETTSAYNDDLLELRDEIRRGSVLWNDNPYKYGAEEVLDGGHTFYTIIYPNRHIESMYIRAWIPRYYRQK